MNIRTGIPYILLMLVFLSACSTAYEAKPLPFKLPSASGNALSIGKTQIGARAFTDPEASEELFGFDVLGAGLLPVQVTFDNQGKQTFQIKTAQTFLVDKDGFLWPILDRKTVYERSSKYAKSKKMLSEGGYKGMLGAAAGGVIGAAVGIVTGQSVAESAGKGAAIGAAAGLTIGGAEGYASKEPIRRIRRDLNKKSLQNKPIPAYEITYGFFFFPAEAKAAKQLRMQLRAVQSQKIYTLVFDL